MSTITITGASKTSYDEIVDYYLKTLVKYSKLDKHETRYQQEPKNLNHLGDVLRALKTDLKSGKRFIDLFAGEQKKGVDVLIDILDLVHSEMEILKKSDNDICPSEIHNSIKKRLAEEYHVLLCLKIVLAIEESSPKQLMRLNSQNKIISISRCLISRFSKSRLLSLVILTRVCELVPQGHHIIMKVMTILRVQLSEDVRFKFLTNLLLANQGSSIGFQAVCLRFLNTLLEKARKASYRVQLQNELAEAGFKIHVIEEKLCLKDLDGCREVLKEIDRWNKGFIDVDRLIQDYDSLSQKFISLDEEVLKARKTIAKLEEDKMNLMRIEEDLNSKLSEKELAFAEIKSKLHARNFSSLVSLVKVTGEGSTKKEEETKDSGRLSSSSQEYEMSEIEMEPPDREEVTVVPTVLIKNVVLNAEGDRRSSKPSYYIFDESNQKPSKVTSVNSSTLSNSQVGNKMMGHKDKIFEEDFDSALSETDSDSKPITWKYPAIPSPLFKRRTTLKPPINNSRSHNATDNGTNKTRARSAETLIVPLMKRHPASMAQSPAEIFKKLSSSHSELIDDGVRKKSSVSFASTRSKYQKKSLSSSSIVEISPMPVPIPEPDYPTEPSESSATPSMSIFRKTSVKFRKAFSERKRKNKPQVWEVI